MKNYTWYVGLDVHADSIAVAACAADGGELRSLGNVPHDFAALRRCLRKLGDFSQMKVCYESGPCGYCLYWQLSELGAECVVVSPAQVPKRPSDRVKTDRRDAEKLARFLRSGDLTPVWVPDPAHEALRDLLRARVACRSDKRRAQQRVEHFLLRHGLRAPMASKGKKAGKKRVKSFGKRYLAWLTTLKFEHTPAQQTFDDYKTEVQHQADRMLRLENEITVAISQAPAHMQKIVEALQALRGVAQNVAATIAIEVGDFHRFRKPTQLMAWAGLVPSEYSSGGPGKARRFGITKTGNTYVRHMLTEAAWSYQWKATGVSASSRRRKNLPATVSAIAQKADERLTKRFARLSATNKLKSKIATAIAREMLGFAWAIATEVSPNTSRTNKTGWEKLAEAQA